MSLHLSTAMFIAEPDTEEDDGNNKRLLPFVLNKRMARPMNGAPLWHQVP